MRKFIMGFISGAMFAVAGTASAAALVGGTGYLLGWDVTINGNTVCSSPYVWPTLREIECD